MRWPASARRRLPRGARSLTPNRSNLIVWSQPFGGYWMAANEPLVSSEYTGQHASADAPQQAAAEAPVVKTRRRLFTKYVALFVAVVCIALDRVFGSDRHQYRARAARNRGGQDILLPSGNWDAA